MSRKKPSNRKRRSSQKSPQQGLAAFLPEFTPAVFAPSPDHTVRLMKFLTGLLLLPVCWLLLETSLVLLRADTLAAAYWRSPEFLALGAGGFAWLVLFFCARNRFMMWLYVAGHELTHALFVLLFRGKVSKVHISSEGGHILTNRNNFIISLSPYFFPFYTVIAIALWACAEWIFRDSGGLNSLWLYGLIGLTWMFHLTFTLWMIQRDQPDVDQNGRLFSFTLIFIANLLLICVMLIIASPTATFVGFGISLWENGQSFVSRLIESATEVYHALPFGGH